MAFCPNCGAAYEGSPGYCQTCGKPLTYAAPSSPPFARAPERIQRPLGVTIIGVLQIIGSIFTLVIGLGFAAILGPIGLIIIPFAVLPLVFAFGVFTGRNWARILMMIGAVLDILSIVGIIWGIIVLWYFTRPRVVAYFKQPK